MPTNTNSARSLALPPCSARVPSDALQAKNTQRAGRRRETVSRAAVGLAPKRRECEQAETARENRSSHLTTTTTTHNVVPFAHARAHRKRNSRPHRLT